VIKLKQMMAGSDADENFKRIEQQKLNGMLGLAELTTCRRQTLMGYFGDTLPQPCGNCDNCLTPVKTWDGTDAARKALSCVFRTDQRFGVGHLVNVLRGKVTDKITQFNHHTVSTFGIGKDLSDSQWKSVFRQLVARGYLNVNFDYGQLSLSETSRSILRGEESLMLRVDTMQTKSSMGGGSKKSKSVDINDDDIPLWEALRACRTSLASEQGIPPFMIFHDATLKDMLDNKPSTLESFGTLSGVGQKKLDKYGADFLAVLEGFNQ
jgi:ATP-dependent DNA helicase RecQ